MKKKLANQPEARRKKPRFPRLLSAYTALAVGFFGSFHPHSPNIINSVGVREVMAEPIMALSKANIEKEAVQAVQALKNFLLKGDEPSRNRFFELWNKYGSNDDFWNKFVEIYQGRPKLGIPGEIVGRDKALLALHNAYKAAKGNLVPLDFATAVAHCYEYLNNKPGHLPADRLQKLYGSFFNEFMSIKGMNESYAAKSLFEYSKTGDTSKLQEFTRIWRTGVPDHSKLGKREKEFITRLNAELKKQSKALADAVVAYGNLKHQRYPDYLSFAEAVQGASADLKKQKPGAITWMNKKYTEQLLSFLANQMYSASAESAVKSLETFITRPKDLMFKSRFLNEWEKSDAGFVLAFHAKARSSKIGILMLDYEKKAGQVNDGASAKSFMDAIESVYDNLRSGSPQVALMHAKYGMNFVNAIRRGTLVSVPQKIYKSADVKKALDEVESRLESLEKYFRELKMSRNIRVRSHLDRWSDQLSLARKKFEQGSGSNNELFTAANDLRLDIPPQKYVKMVVLAADMDSRNIDRIYYGKKSYSYTITEGWISRMEALLKTIDSTRNMAALDWVYNERMRIKVGDVDAIKTQVGNLKATVYLIKSTLSGMAGTDTMKQQMESLSQSLTDMSMPVSSDFKVDMFNLIQQSKVMVDASAVDSTKFWADQVRLIESLLDKLPGEFRERVAIQFYSKWHEEASNVRGYKSLPAAMGQIIGPAASFKRMIDTILPQLTIENKYQASAPGVRPAFTQTTLNSNGEVYDAYRTLPLESQYELSRQFMKTFGLNPTYWDNDTWAKFAAAVNGVSDIPGSHAPLLIKRLGPKLFKQHPNTIYTVLQVISGYSRVFYPGGHYRELSAYYESLPPKLDKMFTDIFSLKDQIKEDYNDVRIIKPTEQDQYYNLLIPAARVIVQVPKHVYQNWASAGLIVEKREASRVYKSASPPPNIPATEMRFFSEKVIEGRLNLPRPSIVPILALNKVHLLAPNYIPEVGEWYSFLATQQVMTAWERQKLGDTTQEASQALSRSSLTMTGEGKSLTGTYALQRGTGTKSTDEGTVRFTNLSFNENRLPNAWLIDLEEFKSKHPEKSRQSIVWKKMASDIDLRVVVPEAKLSEPKSAPAKAVAGILDSVSSFAFSRTGKGTHNVSVLSDRGALFTFETGQADLSGATFRADFFGAISNLKSDDMKKFRKLRLHAFADSVHAYREQSGKGANFTDPDSLKAIDSRFKRIESKTIDLILSSLTSVYFEPVKVREKSAYLAEVRMGTTAIFSFTTTTTEPSSAQFQAEFWNGLSELDTQYVRGLTKDKGTAEFADALSLLNSMPRERQEALFRSMQVANMTKKRLELIAIPLSTGTRQKKESDQLAKRILEKITITGAGSGQYEVTVGEAKDKVVIGTFAAKTAAEIQQRFIDLMHSTSPEEIKTKGLSNSKYMGKLWRASFGPGRNAVNGDAYIRRDDDRLTRVRTGITAIAPGGADTAVYFDRAYQGTTGESQARSISDKLYHVLANKSDEGYNQLIAKFNNDIYSNIALKDSSVLKQFNLSDSEIDALSKKMSLDDFKGIIAKARDDATSKRKKDDWVSLGSLKNSLIDDHHLYDAYIFKRIENGSFALVDVKTLNKTQVEQTYQTIKPEADLSHKLYSRVHPVIGKFEGELEGALIFAGDKTEKQGAGAAAQVKKWGGYYLHEATRGGRLSAGIASMDPEKRRYWVGRFYHSNIEEKTIRTKRGTIETEKGYHVQGTYLEADKLRIEGFFGKQSMWEYGGIGDYIHDKFYLGGGFARLRERAGGYGYIMDKNLINAAVVSALWQNDQLQAVAGGGRALLGQLNLEIRGGGIGQRNVGKGGFLQLTYFPDRGLLGFNSISGIGVLVRGDRDLSIGGIELGGNRLELDAYFNPTGGAGELKLHFPNLDITAGGAGGMENIAKWAAWGGARYRFDSATLFGVVSAGREITIDTDEDLISKEFMAGGRLLLSPADYRYARSWYGIAGFSGIFQDMGQEWGRQFDLQAGALASSFYDSFTFTAGYQNWENKDRIRDSLTMQAMYTRILPWWVFRDVAFSASAAVGRDLTKDPEWSRAFIQFMLQMRGGF